MILVISQLMEERATEQDTRPSTDGAGISDAVERLALMLSENGLPRMTARVFAYALVDDSDRYTASELATGLRVSQAAISGAVRHLVQLGFLDKVRDPGSRSDQYRLYDDDVWSAIAMQRLPVLDRWEEAVREITDQVPPGPGHQRLNETLAYFAFMREEIPRLIDRWKEYRTQLDPAEGPAPEPE